MSNPFAQDGGDHRHPTDAASSPAGSPRQFAHGGNGSTGIAQPAPIEAVTGLDGQMPTATDSLVMLQLASFEGRAL
jgi:hypothetical protein